MIPSDAVVQMGATASTAMKTSFANKRYFETVRNFTTNPVIIGNSQSHKWTDCRIGCIHIPDQSHADVSFGKEILLTMESAVYYPDTDVSNAHKRGVKYVMTPRLSSDVPVGYFSWAEYNFMEPVTPKTDDYDAVAVISNCGGNSFRLDAINMMESLGIRVDKYGACFGRRLQGDKTEALKKYKFSLAFENSIEEDYVTEKFLQSLVAGSVPVVIGCRNIHDFEPAPNSLLYVESLESVPSVVALMKAILEDETKYNAMLKWKKVGPSEKFLALVDMAVVHSSCRICIKVGDDLLLEHIRKYQPDQTNTLYIRERGTFEFHSLHIDDSSIGYGDFLQAVRNYYLKLGTKPIWFEHRKDFLNSGSNLKVYRIYQAFNTARRSLYDSDIAIDSSEKLSKFLHGDQRFLEVIFI